MSELSAVLMEARHVWHRFKRGGQKITALRDVSLHIRRGETLGIAGESGSGKSTLVRLLIGLETIQQGEIYFQGRNTAQFKRKDRRLFYRHIGVVFQQPQLSFDPRWPLKKSLAEPLRVHGVKSAQKRAQTVTQTAAKCGLEASLLDMFPTMLSGGQLQRAAIARALMLKPELIFLDEPTAALDVSIQAQILNLLKDLKQREGLTLVFVSHDLAVLSFLADRLLILKNGQIVEQGATERVLWQPQTEYAKQLIAAVPE